MPQMAPLMWLSVLFTTLVILLMLIIFNYFIKTTKTGFNGGGVESVSPTKWLW